MKGEGGGRTSWKIQEVFVVFVGPLEGRVVPIFSWGNSYDLIVDLHRSFRGEIHMTTMYGRFLCQSI